MRSYELAAEANPFTGQIEQILSYNGRSRQFLPVIIFRAAFTGHM